MSYEHLSYTERMKIAGDMAEGAFTKVAHEKGWSIERYGFNRAKLRNFWRLPEMIKSTPDFACVGKGMGGFLVECKGVGSKPFVRIKEHTVHGLREWQQKATLYVFIYNSSNETYSFTEFRNIDEMIKSGLETDTFDDGKTYYKIPKTTLAWEDMPS